MPTHRIVRSGVGYVPEDREVFASLTVEENLKLAEVPGRPPDYDTVHELFPELLRAAPAAGRDAVRRPAADGGAGQGAARPGELLLVDEPTKGLAPKLVAEVGDVLARVAERTTVLLVEQNLPLVRRIADTAVVIDTGRVVHHVRCRVVAGRREAGQLAAGGGRRPDITPAGSIACRRSRGAMSSLILILITGVGSGRCTSWWRPDCR